MFRTVMILIWFLHSKLLLINSFVVAKKFFTDHYQKFVKKSNQLQFLNSMQTSLNNNCLNQALQNFKNYKCRILITEESFNLLSKFLTVSNDHRIVKLINRFPLVARIQFVDIANF